MHKKLIRKGQAGMMASLLGNSAKSASTPSWGLNASWQKSAGLNLQPNLPKFNTSPQPISNSLLKPIQGPDMNKQMSNLNTTLNDKGFQDRMAKGQSDNLTKIKKAESAEGWNNFKTGASEFLNSDIGKAGLDGAMSIASGIPEMFGKKSQDGISAGINAAAPLLNAAVPGLGYAVQGLDILDRSLGKSTKSFNGNTGISGYQDFSSQGKDYRFTQGKARKMDQFNKNIDKKMFVSAKSNTDNLLKQGQAKTQAIGNTGMRNQSQLSGGNNFSVLTAKKGATLQDIRNYLKTRNIEKEVVPAIVLEAGLEISEVQKFQKGGSLIPSGALHKNKHNLEFVNPDLKGEITGKGIPVISYAEKGEVLEYEKDGETPKILADGGEIIQHAEIEKDEVILDLNLSKKLVELMKKGTPEAMIEAGKLLAEELMENTTDNTGLIEKTIGNEN